ncbi:MAG: hypothetical protein IPM74_12705 [Crocinitomicaceae bacterium]|nr:hypothetical protein [Crocinitomicaceae bacterium]MBK8926735.1 hypothetical protein [Crocinitomicaceae bacterium]
MKRQINNSVRWSMLVLCLVLLSACKKDDPPLPPESPDKYEHGYVVLNEGLYQQNNASLSFYSLDDNTVYTQCFYTENNRGLGDTGNDMVSYILNDTAYILIAVDVSSQIEIVEANTLKSVAQIPLFNGSVAREPRHVKVYGESAFVCNFDGTVTVINLENYTITHTLNCGSNPDAMVQSGNQLFIANSGGLNFPVYDSTVTVIDMDTKTVVNTIESRINCTQMLADSENEIYLLSNGNYGSISPAIVRISAATHSLIDITEMPISQITSAGDWMYYYDTNVQEVRRMNLLTENFEGITFIDCSTYETFAGIEYDPVSNLIFCFDAKGYVNSSVVKVYNASGIFQYEFQAELNAKKIVTNE